MAGNGPHRRTLAEARGGIIDAAGPNRVQVLHQGLFATDYDALTSRWQAQMAASVNSSAG